MLLRTGACVVAGWMLATGAMAADAKAPAKPEVRNYGQYKPTDTVKAQANVTIAMTTPMPEILSRAAELKVDYMLDYGLGLELGREAATKTMTPVERANVQEVFKDLLALYVQGHDDIQIAGDEAPLLDQPDFWILMARALSIRTPSPTVAVSDPDTGQVTTETADTMVGQAPKGYSLSGQPILDPGPVSAAQSCVIDARADARMSKIVNLDPAATPKLTAAQLSDLKQRAVKLGHEAHTMGVDACGGQAFYGGVFAFAAQHLGKLGALKEEPGAAITVPDTATGK